VRKKDAGFALLEGVRGGDAVDGSSSMRALRKIASLILLFASLAAASDLIIFRREYASDLLRTGVDSLTFPCAGRSGVCVGEISGKGFRV